MIGFQGLSNFRHLIWSQPTRLGKRIASSIIGKENGVKIYAVKPHISNRNRLLGIFYKYILALDMVHLVLYLETSTSTLQITDCV